MHSGKCTRRPAVAPRRCSTVMLAGNSHAKHVHIYDVHTHTHTHTHEQTHARTHTAPAWASQPPHFLIHQIRKESLWHQGCCILQTCIFHVIRKRRTPVYSTKKKGSLFFLSAPSKTHVLLVASPVQTWHCVRTSELYQKDFLLKRIKSIVFQQRCHSMFLHE